MDVEVFGLPARPYSRDFENLSIDDGVDWRMTLGPQKLYESLEADNIDTFKSVVMMRDYAKTEWSINQVLIHGEPFHVKNPTSQNRAWLSQQKMDFEGDVGSGPNFGWVVANDWKYTVDWAYDLPNNADLQILDYVMWDEDRIKGKTLVHLKDLLTWEE